MFFVVFRKKILYFTNLYPVYIPPGIIFQARFFLKEFFYHFLLPVERNKQSVDITEFVIEQTEQPLISFI